MSESDTASVECPLCGESFDPTAAGGWCTNSECGEWQYETDVTPDQGASGDDDADSSSVDEPSDADEASEVAEESGDDGDAADAEIDDAATDEAEQAEGEPEAEAATTDDEQDPAADDGGDAAAADDGSVATESGTDDDGDDDTFDCPGCGSELDADVAFCPSCGEDVSDLPAEDGGDEALDACPSCGTDVGPDDNFCASCGEDLDAHRGGSTGLEACPDCGADVDDDQAFCASCGADLDAHRGGGGATGDVSGDDGSAPDALALAAHGRSVVVEDGDVVGREIRSLLTDAGRPEDEAVRIHREHVRFVREDDQFYVVALGKNPTVVDGTSLAQGDRAAVGPGDELSLSDVVTLTVEAA